MEGKSVKIKTINNVTYNVLRLVTEKPVGYNFLPGQAAEVSINKVGWENEKRPFTFTCLPDDDYLEFTIKIYASHKGVTNELLQLKANDKLILYDVFGTIAYKGEGVFIAGGAGITPFISIFRFLHSKNQIDGNKLIFANKTRADIILEHEFKRMLGDNFINILSQENANGYSHGYVDEGFLKLHIIDRSKRIYLCGPEPMMEAVERQLMNLGIDKQLIVKEEF
jgi:ferredoxin-NADP reductase